MAGTDANQANIGNGGIDILDLLGNLVGSFSTSALGGINSVAVKNNQAAVQTVGFSGFNGSAAALKSSGVRLTGPNASVAQDLEPEYTLFMLAG